MKCPSVELLSASIDGETLPWERPGVQAHLLSCPSCRRSAAGLRRNKDELALLPAPPMPEDLMEALLGLARARGAYSLPLPGFGTRTPASKILRPPPPSCGLGRRYGWTRPVCPRA